MASDPVAAAEEWLAEAVFSDDDYLGMEAHLEDAVALFRSLITTLKEREGAEKRWDRLSRLADSGTARNFLECSDDVKRDFFAMAVDDSSRRKRAEEALTALRRRVVEVGGPFAEAVARLDYFATPCPKAPLFAEHEDCFYELIDGLEGQPVNVEHIRALAQLVKDCSDEV